MRLRLRPGFPQDITSPNRHLHLVACVLLASAAGCVGSAGSPSQGDPHATGGAGPGDSPATPGSAGGPGTPVGSGASSPGLGEPTSHLYPESVLCPAPTAAAPSGLSAGFATSCAGCHGATGQGLSNNQGSYPSLVAAARAMTVDEFTAVVRNGRKLMPGFSVASADDAQLAQDYEALRGATVTQSADPDCGPGASQLPAATDAELQQRIEDGIAIFRKAGSKGACANCHSAAGIDLAFIGYSDAAILRRAIDANHLSPTDAQTLVDFVHALRTKYAITRPLHPTKFRFLQPGGEMLEPEVQPGDDLSGPYSQGVPLDRAFATSLKNDLQLLLATDTIDSLAKAQAAQDQLLGLDYTKLRVGIAVEKWTEDGFRGSEHNTPNEWIPMLGRTPAPGREADWFQLVDAYRADPSDANLWAMYDAIDTLTAGDHATDYANAARWSRNKYRSVQVASHMLLRGSLQLPDPLAGQTPPADPVARRAIVIDRNPFWITGDSVRQSPLDMPGALGMTTFPPELDLTINKGSPSQESPDALRLKMTRADMHAWFWLGFMNDPGLLVQENSLPATNSDYFNSNLVYDGYTVHSAFVVCSVLIHKANAPEEYLTMKATSTEGTGIWASPRPFLAFKQNERDLHFLPAGDSRAPVHEKLWANTFRAAFYLMNDEVARTGKVFDRMRTLLNVNFMYHWFANGLLEPGVDHSDLEALVVELRQRLLAAEEIGVVKVYQDGDATDPVVLCNTGLDMSVPMCTSWGKI